MEADIVTLRREGIEDDNNNDPSPDNVMQSDDVLPTPSTLTFGFNGVDPWCQSGNYPVGRTKLGVTPIPRIQHMYRLELFMDLYLMEYNCMKKSRRDMCCILGFGFILRLALPTGKFPL